MDTARCLTFLATAIVAASLAWAGSRALKRFLSEDLKDSDESTPSAGVDDAPATLALSLHPSFDSELYDICKVVPFEPISPGASELSYSGNDSIILPAGEGTGRGEAPGERRTGEGSLAANTREEDSPAESAAGASDTASTFSMAAARVEETPEASKNTSSYQREGLLQQQVMALLLAEEALYLSLERDSLGTSDFEHEALVEQRTLALLLAEEALCMSSEGDNLGPAPLDGTCPQSVREATEQHESQAEMHAVQFTEMLKREQAECQGWGSGDWTGRGRLVFDQTSDTDSEESWESVSLDEAVLNRDPESEWEASQPVPVNRDSCQVQPKRWEAEIEVKLDGSKVEEGTTKHLETGMSEELAGDNLTFAGNSSKGEGAASENCVVVDEGEARACRVSLEEWVSGDFGSLVGSVSSGSCISRMGSSISTSTSDSDDSNMLLDDRAWTGFAVEMENPAASSSLCVTQVDGGMSHVEGAEEGGCTCLDGDVPQEVSTPTASEAVAKDILGESVLNTVSGRWEQQASKSSTGTVQVKKGRDGALKTKDSAATTMSRLPGLPTVVRGSRKHAPMFDTIRDRKVLGKVTRAAATVGARAFKGSSADGQGTQGPRGVTQAEGFGDRNMGPHKAAAESLGRRKGAAVGRKWM